MNLSKIKNYKSSKGFTLIELLIVIAIIGVLAAVLLVALNPAQRIAAARNSRVREDVLSIGNSANLFNTDTGINAGCVGSYPSGFGVQGSGCTVAVNFMATLNDPSGVAYVVVKAPAACDMNATPCTGFSAYGTAFADASAGIAKGIWCWRSSVGQVTWQLNAAACPAP